VRRLTAVAGPAPRRVAAAVIGAVVGVLVVTATVAAGPARALGRTDSSDQVQAQADRVASRADALQLQLDRALANYQASLNGLAGAVTASVSDDRTASETALLAAAASDGQEARVRALYMSGGSLGLMGSLLDAQDPSDLASRVMFASQVLNLGDAAQQSALVQARLTRDRADSSRLAAQRQIATVQQVERAATRLQRVVDQTRALVGRLSERADRLAAQERLAAAKAAAAAAAAQAASDVTAGGIPVNFLKLYRDAAATCPMPWVVLAAIGQVESGHGSNNGPSSAGAMGPMQFLPSTFAAYAVDGDGDGTADIWNPADAIYSASNYLCRNGAGGSPRALYSAIYRYNHADWYVQLVMSVAAQLADRFGEPVPLAAR
jgi:peptidoglycan hydrolase CwlO-like protein